jgi:hypothetical protein
VKNSESCYPGGASPTRKLQSLVHPASSHPGTETCGLNDLRPHPNYVRRPVVIPASKLSGLAAIDETALDRNRVSSKLTEAERRTHATTMLHRAKDEGKAISFSSRLTNSRNSRRASKSVADEKPHKGWLSRHFPLACLRPRVEYRVPSAQDRSQLSGKTEGK